MDTVEAFKRFGCLEKFYGAKVSNSAVIVEELKTTANLSDDIKGLWAVDQFLKAAQTLHVDPFVIPVEVGGIEIPEIPGIQEYEKVFLGQKQTLMESLDQAIPIKRRAEASAREAAEKAEIEVAKVRKLEEDFLERTKDAMTEEDQLEQDQIEEQLEKHKRALDQKYQKWLTVQMGLQKDYQTIQDWQLEASDKATKQRDRDVDARQTLVNALADLKKFLSGLMAKVPIIDPVVRQMDSACRDPYETSDKDLGLRQCYANLLARFRKHDPLGIATSIMIGMRETQSQSESLGVFTRRVESFTQEMIRLGVVQVSISDLAAMVAISGMKENHRKDFLQTETTLALTLDNMAESEDPDETLWLPGVKDGSVVTKGGSRRSLYEKVVAFSRKHEEGKILMGKFGAAKKDEQKVEAAKKKEAQLAFATEVKLRDPGACFNFAKDGKCANGDSCRFSHTIGGPDAGRNGRQGQRLRGVCFGWEETGVCPWGSRCRFDHPPKDSEPATGVKAAGAPQPVAQGKAQAQAQAQSKAQAPAPRKAQPRPSSVLFTGLSKSKAESESESESSMVVLLKKQHQSVYTVKARSGRHKLGWDTMASINVAKDRSVIPNAQALEKIREACGVGGSRPITHVGTSEIFGGLKMSYIDGGETPNLMSVARELQKDAEGRPGVAIFSESGAVRFRVTPELMTRITQLVDQATAEDLVEGEAVMKNYVYEQVFSVEGDLGEDLESMSEDAPAAYAVSHNMFGSRIRLSSVDQVLNFLAESGLSEETLLRGIKNRSVMGIPPVVTLDAAKDYFKHVDKSPAQLEAEISKARLVHPVDFEEERAELPGEVLQIDNVDPSFSRKKSEHSEEPLGGADPIAGAVKSAKKVVPSVGGYKDAVLAVDEKTGYAHLQGRVSKKDPHKVLELFINKWKGRWGTLKFVKADKEFVTEESIDLVNKHGARFRQAVPGDHRRVISMAEGLSRWIQEKGQANMNRLKPWVKSKLLTETQARSLWYHALRHGLFANNFRPSLSDPGKTRYEMGTGDAANLSSVVMMPFGMRLMGKNLINAEDGRGSECLYIGPSSTVRGGILTYSIATGRVSVKYAFLPIQNVTRPAEQLTRSISKQIYGKIQDAPEQVQAQPKVAVPGWEEIQGYDHTPVTGEAPPAALAPRSATEAQAVPEPGVSVTEESAEAEAGVESQSGVNPESDPPAVGQSGDLAQPVVGAKSGGVDLTVQAKRPAVISNYGTRAKGKARVLVVDEFPVEEERRPPKPKPPPGKVCDQCPLWKAAEAREIAKLQEEDTFVPLPVDDWGRPVRPENAMVLRLLRIREYKWKPDPETGVDRWLECVRLVCDGSVDKRPENYYAETPDRTLLFLMSAAEASLGIKSTGSDVTRAYLNALSLDRNIVVVSPSGLTGLPKEALLNKGLYGSRAGALSWQVWIDERMVKDLQYQKLDVCRGVYMKKTEGGKTVRAYRHSDDFRVSSEDVAGRTTEEKKMRGLVRMAEFAPLDRFLGCTFEYVNVETGEPDPDGTIVLVRQVDKIREMETEFADLRGLFNKRGRVRKNPVPVDAIKFDEDLDEVFGRFLSPPEVKLYQSVVGCVNWVVNSTRPDAMLGNFLLSTRMAKPRWWDLSLAAHMVDYLVGTAEAPLVLGGPVLEPEIYADASFASLPDRRSILGHLAVMGKGSGAIYAQVSTTKTAVTSIWEAELMAGCRGMDTGLYLTQACKELDYPVSGTRVVWVDNKAEVDWVKGSVSNKRSRHIDVRYYRSRHLQETGEVSFEYIRTEDNIADILTKPLAWRLFRKHATQILGHGLVQGKGIVGVFEELSEASLDVEDN